MAGSCHVYSHFPSKTGEKTCHKPAMNLPFGCHSAGEFRKITKGFGVPGFHGNCRWWNSEIPKRFGGS